MQVTPSPSLLEALSAMTQSAPPRPSEPAQKAALGGEGTAAERGTPAVPRQPHLGRFVDITV